MKTLNISLFVLFTTFGFSSSAPEKSTYKVDASNEHKYPSLVYLEVFSEDKDYVAHQRTCGATPIGDNWILTSARCLNKDAKKVIVYPNPQGNKTLSRISPNVFTLDQPKIIAHKDFKSDNYENDIALLYVANKLGVQPFNLPPKIFKPMPIGTVTDMKVNEMEISLELISYHAISKANCGNPHDKFVDDKQLCMQSNLRSLCEKDIGSGLISKFEGKDYVLGVFSYGTDCFERQPAVFTRVSAYTKWITDQMTKFEENLINKSTTSGAMVGTTSTVDATSPSIVVDSSTSTKIASKPTDTGSQSTTKPTSTTSKMTTSTMSNTD